MATEIKEIALGSIGIVPTKWTPTSDHVHCQVRGRGTPGHRPLLGDLVLEREEWIALETHHAPMVVGLLLIDPDRIGPYAGPYTGIYVRACTGAGTSFQTVDIAHIDLPSLIRWARSRGGSNKWAETALAMVLGHEAQDVLDAYKAMGL